MSELNKNPIVEEVLAALILGVEDQISKSKGKVAYLFEEDLQILKLALEAIQQVEEEQNGKD